jgi:hypothetical protein
VLADLVGNANLSSPNPQFTTDRLGNANGSIFSPNIANSNWYAASGVVVPTGDLTVTAWVMNHACSTTNVVCKLRPKPKLKNPIST